MPTNIKSLTNLCLDELNLPNDVWKATFLNEQKSITIHLNRNNRRSNVEKTVNMLNLNEHVVQYIQRGYIDHIDLHISKIHFITALQAWYLIKILHTNEQNSVILPAIRCRVIGPNDITQTELVKCIDAPTYAKIIPYLRNWPLPISNVFGHNVICKSAQTFGTDAPCMTIFKLSLDDWCPICIYRWAEYTNRTEQHESCCRKKYSENWCESCLKMKSDINWASLVHLL